LFELNRPIRRPRTGPGKRHAIAHDLALQEGLATHAGLRIKFIILTRFPPPRAGKTL
jgi:hypothetical protein